MLSETPDHPGNLRVALENAEVQARERAAEVAQRNAKALAEQEETARAAREAAARRDAESWERVRPRLDRHVESTERLGSATPDPPRWSDPAERARWADDATAAGPEAIRNSVGDSTRDTADRLPSTADWNAAHKACARAVLDWRLRHCKSLDDAIREVRYALAAVAKPCDADKERRLTERLNQAEQLYRIHALDRLASLRSMLEREAAELIRADGLPEFAAALESGDWTKILEAAR